MRLPPPPYRRRLSLILALSCATLPAHGFAQSTWSGAANNDFDNSSNWSPAAPTAGDAASVDAGSPQVSNDQVVRQLDVDGGNVTVTNTGRLTATDGTTITSGSLGINAGGVMTSDVNLEGGSLFVDGDLNGQLMLNNGNVAINGTLDSALVGNATALSNNGAIKGVSVSSGGTFVNNSLATTGTLVNAGTSSNAGTIGSLTNTAGGFTNNNGGTVTGKITVAGGTVTNNFVVTDADVAAVASFVNNSGTTAGTVRNAGTVTNAGTIAAVQNDAGTFTNNFGGVVAGETTIGGGGVTNNASLHDVSVGTGASFTNSSGATAGTVSNAGNSSNAGTISGLTNTAGTFTNNAGGTVTGKTTVTGGTVTNNFVITDADVAATATFVNNSGASAGTVRNSGTVSNAGTVASLQNDAGTFTNNTGGSVTGTTTVDAGNVVNNASIADVAVGKAGTFTNNSAATAATVTNAGIATNDGTIAALINDGGSFSNTGLISGAATVSDGTFVNTGTVGGTVGISASGLLAGTGVVGGLFVDAGGTLAPGPGLATVTVNGDVTFRPGSTYQVDIDPSGLSDSAAATGLISIQGGTLDVQAAAGTYATATSYAILNAGSITGSFDAVSSDFAFLSPTLTYGTTAIDMRLARNTVAFANLAGTANARAAATALDASAAGGTLYDAVLSLDAATARRAFPQLSGDIHASLKSTLLSDSHLVRETLLDQVSLTPDDHHGQPTLWTSGFLSASDRSGDGNAAGIDSRAGGFLLGMDTPIDDHWKLGGLLGYSHEALAQADTDSYHAGLYAIGNLGPFNLVGGAIYSHNAASTRRSVTFANFSDQLTAGYDSATSQVFADLSWTTELDAVRFQPFINLAYVSLDSDSFRERGAGAALSGGGDTNAFATSTLGLRWASDWSQTDLPIGMSGMLGWRHNAGDLTPSASLAFAGTTPFIVDGLEMPRDSLLVKVGVTAKLSKSARLTVGYSGEFAQGLRSGMANASLAADF